MSLALARKYRPRNFASVAVQTHVSRTLRGAIARDRVANGYLLCGPRGTGKTTLARVLAMALNCEKRLSGEIADEGEPCGECTSCQRIWGGSASLDVVEIDAASNRGVDDARELRERAMYAPSADNRYKVYIIDEAHMLTREAWNALLKILEEPPPRVVFVFATTEPQRIAQSATPVLSRLQRFDLKRIGAPEIRRRLAAILEAEGVSATADAVAMMARAADGSMRDALSLADQVMSLSSERIDATRVRESLGLVPEDELLALLDIIAGRDAKGVFPAVARLADEGVDFTLLLGGLADLLRSMLAYALGSLPDDVTEKTLQALQTHQSSLAAGDLMRMLNMITEIEPQFRKSSQQQLLIETLLVRFALLDRTVELEELIRGLSQSPTAGGEGAQPARPAPRNPERSTAPLRNPERSAAPLRNPERSSEPPRGLAGKAAPEIAKAAEPPTALDINRLAEKWDDIVDLLRQSGRGLLAGHLAAALPSAVSARGTVTVQVDDATDSEYELLQEALSGAQVELVAALRTFFTGVDKVVLAARQAAAQGAPKLAPAARRLTEEAIRADRLASLRKKDPVLDAAVKELDLELLD